MEFMIDKKISPATALVKTAAAVNVLGNIFGVMIVLIYFVLFQPGVTLERTLTVNRCSPN
jgi:hypothetical protein